jgi:hypothetical protein
MKKMMMNLTCREQYKSKNSNSGLSAILRYTMNGLCLAAYKPVAYFRMKRAKLLSRSRLICRQMKL